MCMVYPLYFVIFMFFLLFVFHFLHVLLMAFLGCLFCRVFVHSADVKAPSIMPSLNYNTTIFTYIHFFHAMILKIRNQFFRR